MGWITAMKPLLLLVAIATLVNGQVETSQERLQELCSRYKFLWSDADPSVFYYCFTNKAAVQLKCRTGYYMCKRDGEPFHPCDCKFDGNLDESEGDSPSEADTRPTGEFPANGCPDPFLRYADFHRFGGTETDAPTLGECQLKCMQDEECVGVDWENTENKCYILPKAAERFALTQREGVTHYMRTFCTTTLTPNSQDSASDPATVPYESAVAGGNLAGGNDISNAGGERFPGFSELEFNGDSDQESGKQGILFTTTLAPGAVVVNTVSSVTGGATAAPAATSAPVVATTTPIPDSGCPFALQKFAMMSHPFGKNITKNGQNTIEEECKFWCVVRPYCQGVDWDSSLNTCYWFQEIQTPLLAAAANVNHYQKTQCGRPLMCWQQSGLATVDTLVAVTDTTTTQVQCIGLCFLRQTVSTTNPTIERGCLTVADGATAPALGCSIDSGSLLTATCYCDTDRCNGLSLSALSSQILYLPLDGDFTDHSGNNRFAVTSNGFQTPTFSCLERYANCSALFTGSQCIDVRQMTQTAWGPVDASGSVMPQLSLAVSFKRLADGSTVEEGIFGNSNSADVAPSWAFVGRTNENIVRAGIDSTTAPTGLNDFNRGIAPANQWHSAVLTYDGRNILALDLPLTRFYINSVRQSGNEQADEGEVQIRAQPVTVGCVQNTNFTGFIDEVRIFNSVLQPNDVEALNIMRDSLYW